MLTAYEVVKGYSSEPTQFNTTCTGLINKGYKPFGNITTGYDDGIDLVLFQAFIKEH